MGGPFRPSGLDTSAAPSILRTQGSFLCVGASELGIRWDRPRGRFLACAKNISISVPNLTDIQEPQFLTNWLRDGSGVEGGTSPRDDGRTGSSPFNCYLPPTCCSGSCAASDSTRPS